MLIINIYLLRHGEIEQKEVLAGKTDFGLSNNGWQQMESAVNDLNISRCFSSPLKRCCLFAKEFCKQKQIPLTLDSNIQEYDFGDWDGKNYQELWQMPKPNIGCFWQNPSAVSPPNGEQFTQFNQRVKQWWQNLIDYPDSGDILVVAHAGVIKQILALIVDENNQHSFHSRFKLEYGRIVTVQLSFDEHHKPWPVVVF